MSLAMRVVVSSGVGTAVSQIARLVHVKPVLCAGRPGRKPRQVDRDCDVTRRRLHIHTRSSRDTIHSIHTPLPLQLTFAKVMR